MKKKGLAKLGQVMGNMLTGHLKDYEYPRRAFAKWDIPQNGKWILTNVNIIDVDQGSIKKEKALLINSKKIERLLDTNQVSTLQKSGQVSDVVDGIDQYLIPGLSDIHCHLGLVSEFDMSWNVFYYADAQRMRNCENALERGCTFTRTSGGAYDMVSQLTTEIEADRLLGPKIMPSYFPLIPKGGCWDFNPVVNKTYDMVVGGKFLNHIKTDNDLDDRLRELHKLNAKSVKIYLEEKPLYGGREDMKHTLFTDQQLKTIREYADNNGKPVEAHAMFINGARLGIRAKVDSLAHLTVDESYSLKDAEQMVENGTAIVPTLGAGCLLAMDCGEAGYPNNPEYVFYRKLLKDYIPGNIKNGTIPELVQSNIKFFNSIWERNENRKMPMMGPVYPKRAHGFAVYAPESLENFKTAGTKIGMGTDGGTGIMWTGALDVEFAGYQRYGFTPAEILRFATLGNMKILNLDKELGSLDEGKYADMVLLGKNPLQDISAIGNIKKVFKNGRCYVDNEG